MCRSLKSVDYNEDLQAELGQQFSFRSQSWAEKVVFPSPSSVANMEEANKLIGTGKKHLVMGKAVEAVSALQEACGMLWVN